MGLMIDDKLPAILAKDVVGRITKIGEDVKSFEVRDRVLSLAETAPGFQQSGLQEYAVADLANLMKIPDSVNDDEAATLSANLSAVFGALFLKLGIPTPWTEDRHRPEQLLIVGGGSNCSKFAIQLAKLASIQTIVVVGGDEKHLKELGAVHVIDRQASEQDVVEKIRNVVGDDLTYALDCVNLPDGLGLAFSTLSRHRAGKLARLLPLGTIDKEASKGHEVIDVAGNFFYRDELLVKFWKRIPGILQDGSIRPSDYEVTEGLNADSVNHALNKYQKGGKVIKQHIHL